MNSKRVVTILSFLVGVLIITIFVLVVYILTIDEHASMNDVIPSPSSSPDIEAPPVVEEVEINDEELIKKLNSKTIDNLYVLPFMTLGKTKDFANWKKIILTISKYEKEIATPIPKSANSEVKRDDLEEKMKELFGSKITYQDRTYNSFSHKLFPLITNVYYYDGVYTLVNSGAGHGLSTAYYSIPLKLTKVGDVYKLQVYRVFRPVDEIISDSSPRFYSDYDFENKILDLTDSNYKEKLDGFEGDAYCYPITEEELREELIKNKDNPNLVIDTYYFEKEGDNYVWVEYETTAKN